MSFVLVSSPRAGTHMVRSVLDQHPDLDCYGEVFNRKTARWYPELEGKNIQEVLKWMKVESDGKKYGFALHMPGQGNAISESFWRRCEIRTTLPIVYVFRRNSLRQTLSQWRSRAARATSGGGYLSYRKDASDYRRFGCNTDGLQWIGKLHIECEQFHEEMLHRHADEVAFLCLREWTRICPVAYEDFVANPLQEARRLTEFLNIPFSFSPPQTIKTGTGTLESMIENVKEFTAYFSRTPFRRWLVSET